MCHVLLVSRAGYYAWLGRPESQRAVHQAQVVEQIRQVHRDSRQVYGSPRVYRALKAQGVACSENTVAKLMRRAGVRAATSRRFVVRTTDSRHGHAIADNALDRQFEPGEVDRTWVGDITYIPTERGVAVPGGGDRPGEPQGDRLGDGGPPAERAGGAGALQCPGASPALRAGDAPQRPGRAVCLR